MRTFSDSSGNEWPASVLCYAVTISPGANVLQAVTSSSPLPVTAAITGSVAVTGTFWQTTQPVSGTVAANAGTNLNTSLLALETGGNLASINTKLPSQGQALAAASMPVVLTAAQLSTLVVAQASATSGESGPLVQGAVTTSAPTYTTGQTSPLSLDTSGNLRVNVMAGGGTGGTSSTFGASYPATGTAIGAKSSSGSLMSALNLDSGGNLYVNVAAGGAGGGIVTQATAANLNALVAQGAAGATPWLANHADPSVTTGNITAADSGTSSTTGQSGQTIITGTPTANSSQSVTLSGHTALNIQATGTWIGTLTFERSIDGGTTYYPASVLLHGVGGSALATITGNCCSRVNVGGSSTFRVRCTAYTSGTAVITFKPGFGDQLVAATNEAGSNLLGSVGETPQIAAAYNGLAAVTPQYATFTTSSSGPTTIVALSAGKKIYVLRWSISSNGNTNVNLQSHATTSLATGLRYMTQYAQAGGAYCPTGIMATAAGEALDVNNSAAVAISGEITYCQF